MKNQITKFDVGKIYVTHINAFSTYFMEIANRNSVYATILFNGFSIRRKIKTTTNGIEYVNASKFSERREIVFSADSIYKANVDNVKVEPLKTEPVQKEIKSVIESVIESITKFSPKPITFAERFKMTQEKNNLAVDYNHYLCTMATRIEELAKLEKEIAQYEIEYKARKAKVESLPEFNLTWEQTITRIEFNALGHKLDYALSQRVDIVNSLKYHKARFAEIAHKLFSVNLTDIEDDGSNDDDYDEEEITIDYKFDVEEEDNEDELIDPPVKYAVLSADGVNRYKLNGKLIKCVDAKRELFIAAYGYYGSKINHNLYAANNTVLLVERTACARLNLISAFTSHNAFTWVKVVDLGKYTIPFINSKVSAIVADRRRKAKEEAEEKARVDAYYASPEYNLNITQQEIQYCGRFIAYKQVTIQEAQREILRHYARIAELEEITLETSIEIIRVKNDRDDLIGKAKVLKDEIATREAFKHINSVAVDIEDDGSNDDVDEEEISIDTPAVEEDDDDELVDPPEESEVKETGTSLFEMERFNEGEEVLTAAVVDTSITSVAEVPIVDAYAEIEDEIKCKLEAIEGLKAEVEKLREQLKDLKKKDEPVDEESALFEEYKTLDAEVDEFYRKFFFKRGALDETRRKLTDVLKKKFEPYVYLFNGLIEKASNNDAEIILHSQDGKGYDIAEGNWEEFDIYLDFANSPKYIITYRLLRIVEYQTLDAIKAAIEGLAAAIERGDTEFTFPADKTK